jgi:hypothetical protein
MQCPNCRHEEDDAAAECSKCGFVLAKWRARSQQAQAGQPAAPVQSAAAAKPASGVDLSIWILLLVATIGVWKLNRSGQDQASGPARAASAETAASAAESAIPDNSWRFTGRVMDLLRSSPIKGAKVSFYDWETGRQFEDVTDDEGRYSVDADIRWKSGYAVEISHPLYLQRIFDGSALAADRKERLRMGLETPAAESDTRSYRGTRKKEPVTLDFALFPQDLSDSERQEAGQ